MTDLLSGLSPELRKAVFCLRCYGYGRPEITEKNCPFSHDKYVLPAVLAAKEMLRIKRVVDEMKIWHGAECRPSFPCSTCHVLKKVRRRFKDELENFC